MKIENHFINLEKNIFIRKTRTNYLFYLDFFYLIKTIFFLNINKKTLKTTINTLLKSLLKHSKRFFSLKESNLILIRKAYPFPNYKSIIEFHFFCNIFIQNLNPMKDG